MLWDFYGKKNWQGSDKKKKVAQGIAFGCMYKVHRLKGRTSKQQKQQSLLSSHKKNSTERESRLLHKKELHFSHTCWDRTSKILGCLTGSGVHVVQVPECHCTSEPNIPAPWEIAVPVENAFPSKPTEVQSDFAPCRRQFGPLRTNMLLAFEGWAFPHDVLLTPAQCSALFDRDGKKYHCVGS